MQTIKETVPFKKPDMEAYSTEWAVCNCAEYKDAFMLVLLNEDDEPVATACYDFHVWRRVFKELEDIRMEIVGDA